eukprot:TRINITY_DN28848_c0_g1_i1.p1 TRINITY_DN28848_c0_g1~~TRINITY_DN28848_c0_g1_i1.p1  ORF type:complete len:328 (-),score=45.30 TRINITY_DN28848_c0_g1_i1:60-1043(-)
MDESLETLLVDSVEQCQVAVAHLLKEVEVAVDVEGVMLGRAGEVCLIQICGPSTPTYVFDIHILKERAFNEGGLKELLESEHVTKLFYDLRADCDALHHLYDLTPRGAYDIQILWHVRFQHPDLIYLQGLKKVLGSFLQQTSILTPEAASAIDVLKLRGQSMFAPEHGGSYDVWKERPLHSDLLEYAAADVKFLLGMKGLWASKDAVLDDFVREASAERLLEFVALPSAEALDQSKKCFRDFDLPEGFNETGDISTLVDVPNDMRGLVIGKRGATIRDIESSTGVMLSLVKDGARVVGQPAQVAAAVIRIKTEIASGQHVPRGKPRS